MKNVNYLPAAAAVVVALFSPASFADNAGFRFGRGDVSVGINIGMPPPPVVEYVPVAVPGYAWAPGYWAWNGHRYFWNSGAWQRVQPGYGHVAGHWWHKREHWQHEPPHWDGHRSFESHREKRDYVQRSGYQDRRDQGPPGARDARRDHGR